MPDLPLIVILGPTAVGKTDVSIQLAENLGGEIVSADSRLFYRGMDIGTAKPSAEQRSRVPHHLIDVADPDETWSLAVFQRAAREAISAIHSRGRLPFLVGGSGQYIRAVTGGWTPPEVESIEPLRAFLDGLANERGPSWLYERLAAVDPAAAARIDPRNRRRTVRAWEVILLTGRRFSDQRTQTPSPYSLCQIGLTRPRAELFARVDERIHSMFAAGLLEEVRGLLEKGYTPDLPSMSAIGYKESVAVLRGEIDRAEAQVQMKRRTRIFIRRQANWFKQHDPDIHWFDAGDTPIERIQMAIETFLVQAAPSDDP